MRCLLIFIFLPYLSFGQNQSKIEDLQATITQLKADLEDSRFELKIANNQYQEAIKGQEPIDRLQKLLNDCKVNSKSDLEALQKVILSQDKDLQLAHKEVFKLKSHVDTLRDDLLRTDAALQNALATNVRRTRIVNGGSVTVMGNENPTTTRSKDTRKIERELRRTYTPKSSQYYIRGPRGGCYYLTASGRKEYVDRSLCN